MKKIISGVFVAIMLFVCSSSLLVEAETLSYDAKAAVEYAAAHWDDGVGECATFVSNCLKAGGCSAWDSIVGNLLNELITGNWGTYCKTAGTAGKLLSITGNEDIISPGDPLFRVCEKCKNTPHVVICNRIDSSGNIRVYGHNDQQNDELTNWSNLTCSKCNQKCVYYVFHMTGTNKNILGYYYIVNDQEGHNVRSSASTSASVVGVLPDGEKVLITKYSSDNGWGYVTYGGFEGWTNLSSTYMKFDSVCYEVCEHNYSSTSYESTHPHKEYKKCSLCGDIQYTGNTKLVSGCTSCYPPDGYLYKSLDDDTSNPSFPGKWIRSSDSTSGTVIGSVLYGEYAVVTKYNSDKTWAYVKYKGIEGWTKLYESTFPYQDTYYCPVVTFNANGGSVSTSSKKVYLNNPYGTLPTPTRTGYKFNGWYTSSSGGSKITSTTNVNLTANQTLYAQWTANKYTITYNPNGGTGAPASQTKVYGTNLTLSNTKPTRSGYTFKGWSTSASGSVAYAAGATYSSNSAVTLYAVWEANSVSFSSSMQAYLNLEGLISMSVGYKFSDMDSFNPEDYTDKVGLLVWDAENAPTEAEATYDNCTNILEGARYNSALGRFETITEGIVAKKLGDQLCFRAYCLNEDGSYSYSKYITNYSPKTYCYNQITKNADDEVTVELMASILNYGAAAQKYFGYRTDDLMNADLPEELK